MYRPCANNVIECEVGNVYNEPKVRHVETTSKGNDEQLDDLNPSCTIK